jgi:protein-tyrosine phosphatase
MKDIVKVLFVCMGNICRSPAAEGVLKHLAAQNPHLRLEVASCGIGDWHIGKGPDARIREASLARGINLVGCAQQFKKEFLQHYDYILASDQEIVRDLYHYAQTPEQKSKIFLMTAFSSLYKDQDVPDPYYGGLGGFELVLDMLEDGCKGFVEYIQSRN